MGEEGVATDAAAAAKSRTRDNSWGRSDANATMGTGEAEGEASDKAEAGDCGDNFATAGTADSQESKLLCPALSFGKGSTSCLHGDASGSCWGVSPMVAIWSSSREPLPTTACAGTGEADVLHKSLAVKSGGKQYLRIPPRVCRKTL